MIFSFNALHATVQRSSLGGQAGAAFWAAQAAAAGLSVQAAGRPCAAHTRRAAGSCPLSCHPPPLSSGSGRPLDCGAPSAAIRRPLWEARTGWVCVAGAAGARAHLWLYISPFTATAMVLSLLYSGWSPDRGSMMARRSWARKQLFHWCMPDLQAWGRAWGGRPLHQRGPPRPAARTPSAAAAAPHSAQAGCAAARAARPGGGGPLPRSLGCGRAEIRAHARRSRSVFARSSVHTPAVACPADPRFPDRCMGKERAVATLRAGSEAPRPRGACQQPRPPREPDAGAPVGPSVPLSPGQRQYSAAHGGAVICAEQHGQDAAHGGDAGSAARTRTRKRTNQSLPHQWAPLVPGSFRSLRHAASPLQRTGLRSWRLSLILLVVALETHPHFTGRVQRHRRDTKSRTALQKSTTPRLPA